MLRSCKPCCNRLCTLSQVLLIRILFAATPVPSSTVFSTWSITLSSTCTLCRLPLLWLRSPNTLAPRPLAMRVFHRRRIFEWNLLKALISSTWKIIPKLFNAYLLPLLFLTVELDLLKRQCHASHSRHCLKAFTVHHIHRNRAQGMTDCDLGDSP